MNSPVHKISNLIILDESGSKDAAGDYFKQK
jgi:hypothetical protein